MRVCTESHQYLHMVAPLSVYTQALHIVTPVRVYTGSYQQLPIVTAASIHGCHQKLQCWGPCEKLAQSWWGPG